MNHNHLFYANARPLVLAHRGANRLAPENTLAAFRLAAELGADGVELDVQLSQDGQAVVMHDFTVNKTTNGRGAVKSRTLAELKTLDAGAYFSADFAATPIPTLSEVFLALGPVLLFNIELKTAAIRDEGLEAEVIRLVEDFNLADRVVLSSFNPFALRRAWRVNPAIKRGLLWYPGDRWFLRRQLFRSLARPDMFHPHWQAVTPALVQREHARGLRVNPWTCNEPEALRRLIAAGVDAIITDYPDRLRQILAE